MLDNRRIILVAGVPPCTNYSGGLFLDTIVRAAGAPVGIFVAQNPHVRPVSSLTGIDTLTLERPNELHAPGAPSEAIRQHELGSFARFVEPAREQLLQFARKHEATDLWFVLEGQSLIRLAHSLLDVPDRPNLRVQVMDPPEWWLRAHNVDAESCNEVLDKFSATMRAAESRAAASWGMAVRYEELYGLPATPLIPSIESSALRVPARSPEPNSLRVGFAGQVYAPDEFMALVEAMRRIKREEPERRVELHAFCQGLPFVPAADDVVIPRGWLGQSELIEALTEMDFLYCPYWFSEDMRETTLLSFPSKLVTYLAAGRPVVFHGRTDASPARFLIEGGGGYFCFREGADAVARTLKRALVQPDLYAQTAKNGRELALKHLTYESLGFAFRQFMGQGEAKSR